VLGDVCDPQLVALGPSEVPIDEIASGRLVRDAPVFRPTREPLEAGSAHQQRHRFGADRETMTERQLRVDASIPIDATEVGMDLTDEVSEPGVADRPRRRRA
jgi:hypothetical protein